MRVADSAALNSVEIKVAECLNSTARVRRLNRKYSIKELKALRENVLSHYSRMMKYASAQRAQGSNRVRGLNMYNAIGETWSGTFCPLCRAASGRDPEDPCSNCYIGHIHSHCMGTWWIIMEYSSGWQRWLKAARREYLFLSMLMDNVIRIKEAENE
jgi:hypothetical protein